jgi:hypothetical protein
MLGVQTLLNCGGIFRLFDESQDRFRLASDALVTVRELLYGEEYISYLFGDVSLELSGLPQKRAFTLPRIQREASG